MAKRHKIPRRVHVGYQTVEIRRRRLSKVDGHYFARKDPPLIEIDKPLSGSEAAVTLLHEVVHAAWHNYVPHRGILKKMSNEDLEESVVNGLSNGIADVLKRNPGFLLWFIQEVKR